MQITPTYWSRRLFIQSLSAATAGLLLRPLAANATPGGLDPKIADIVRATIGIDTHNHIDVPLLSEELPGPDIALASEIQKSGLSAICMTFAVDYVKLTYEGQAYERFLTGLKAMDAVLQKNAMTRCLNTADILKAHKSGQPTVIQSVEGGHFLEGKVDRLQLAYDRGLRHLGLLHDHDASTPLGDIFTEPPRWGGLTKFGASVIRESERLGILVDLAHADDNTINGALKVATKPVIITHTGLNTRLGNNPAMAKMMLPRLISKSQAKIVVSQGGVIGVWTHLADNAQQMADNIKAMVDVVGIDHVAIGTDTKLTTPYHSPKDHFEQHDKNKQVHPAVINGSTEEPRKSNHQHRPSGETTTNSLWPPLTKGGASGFYYELVAALLKAGYDQKAIGKIGGGNYLRVFDLATAKQA